MNDPTTDLLSLVGWEQAVAAEEHRHRRYGAEEAAVLVVRVPGAGGSPRRYLPVRKPRARPE